MKIPNIIDQENKNNIREYLSNYDNLPFGVAISKNDLFFSIVNANNAFYNIIGYTKDDFLTNCNNQINNISIDNIDSNINKLPTQIDNNKEFDLRIKKSDNSTAWIHVFAFYNNDIDMLFLTIMDITSKMIATTRELSYEAFEIRNKILYYTSQYTTEHIIVTDIETDEIIYMNQSAANFLGFKDESDWHGKSYLDIGFGGNKSKIHPHFYEPLTEEFTTREYFNDFYNIYINVKNKLIKISSLDKEMRLLIITDITYKKQLQEQLILQKTLHDCVDAMFTTASTDKITQTAYKNILNILKNYFNSEAAFFYKFKIGTNEIEEIYKIFPDGVLKNKNKLPITLDDDQINMINYSTKTNIIDESMKSYFSDKLNDYNIKCFLCQGIKNANEKLVGFLGVINPNENKNNKELLELLSPFICMFIEHEQDDAIKEKSLKLEAISNTKVVDTCVKNFQTLVNSKEKINNTLSTLCYHYDSDFAVIILKKDDGSYEDSYVAGPAIPDLTQLQSHATSIMSKLIKELDSHPEFVSYENYIDLNVPNFKSILNEQFGIYNFIVSPIKDTNNNIIGLLFVNNFKLLHRSRLLVHIVTKNISDYLTKIRMHERTQLEPLTKLTNKIATENLINNLISKEKKGTLFIMDIDNFKGINDKYGHIYGDQAIIELSVILKKVFTKDDVVGRIGGDEFMVFSPELTTYNSITNKANEILDNCNSNNKSNKNLTKLHVSIGICSINDKCNTFESLYKKADYSLYMSKNNGKHRYSIYSDL